MPQAAASAASFDVVTCQTVLMHLASPLDALREMLRILRPGGLLVCVEPNNFWNYLSFTSLTEDEPVEVLVYRFEFWLRQHRGRLAAGQGNVTASAICCPDILPAGLDSATSLGCTKTTGPRRSFRPTPARLKRPSSNRNRQWKRFRQPVRGTGEDLR